jgi:hypothetical protein
MEPYRRQSWSAEQEIQARLLQPIDSRTAKRGAPIEAVVTRPIFAADGALRIPEGSRLDGEIVDARPSRSFHRNGKLLFVFRQLKLPGGVAQPFQGYLEGVDADFDAHMAIDTEGARRVNGPKTRFIFPATWLPESHSPAPDSASTTPSSRAARISISPLTRPSASAPNRGGSYPSEGWRGSRRTQRNAATEFFHKYFSAAGLPLARKYERRISNDVLLRPE